MTESGGPHEQPRDAEDLQRTQYLPPVQGQPSAPGWGAPRQDPPLWQSHATPDEQQWQEGRYWQPQQPAYPASDYGSQPYGYYGYPGTATVAAPAPRKKSHALLWTLLALVVIAAGLVAAAFVIKPAFLPFKRVFDAAAIESTIQQQSGGRFTSVSCPANEPAKKGVTFQCTAANGRKIDVRVLNNSGDYTWSPAG